MARFLTKHAKHIESMPATEYPNASLIKRLMSTLYDVLIVSAVSLFYFALVTAFFELILNVHAEDFKPNAQGLAVKLGWVATIIGFYCFFWLKVGQTVAMKAWRLKLVTVSGDKLTLTICMIRSTLGFIALACFGLGYLWMLFDKDKLALHDRLSGTRVIQLPKGS